MILAPGTVPVVDAHTHAMPEPLLRGLAASGLAEIGELARGRVRIAAPVSGVPSGTPIPCGRLQTDVGERTAAMDAAGVDVHLVSLPPFLAWSRSDGRSAAEWLRAGNDALAEFVSAAPRRLRMLGTVPVGTTAAADEARRCLDELGAAGLVCGTQGADRELDDPVNAELWEFAADRGAFILLHPSATPDERRMGDYWLPQLLGYPVETALAVSRLVLSGMLDRYPLRLCLAHGGGCLPSLRGRLDLGWRRKPAARMAERPPTSYLDDLYYDTAVFSDAALLHLVREVGADHVLLGSDTPFDLSDRNPPAAVRALGLDPGAEERILGRNAAALLPAGACV